VILTSSQDGSDFAECRRLGADNYILKPVDFQRLCKATPQLNLDWALVKPLKQNTQKVRT
jgi:DNA-binding NarL/FixJ family response regulator